jgi:hypothetical protein
VGNTIARLFPFARRSSRGGASRTGDSPERRHSVAADDDPAAEDGTELGPPPVLRPAAIFRQLLYDPAELTPVWARPRAVAAPEPPTAPTPATAPTASNPPAVEPGDPPRATLDQPKPAKRTRRPKADAAAAGPTRQTAKRPARKGEQSANR